MQDLPPEMRTRVRKDVDGGATGVPPQGACKQLLKGAHAELPPRLGRDVSDVWAAHKLSSAA
jgi:hypothetical protein